MKYISPYRIALLALIQLYCERLLLPRHGREILFRIINLIQSGKDLETLSDFERWISGKSSSVVGRNVYELLLKKVSISFVFY